MLTNHHARLEAFVIQTKLIIMPPSLCGFSYYPMLVGRTIFRVGHHRMYTPYMTVDLVISLPELPYIHRMYMVMVNPNYLPKRWH